MSFFVSPETGKRGTKTKRRKGKREERKKTKMALKCVMSETYI